METKGKQAKVQPKPRVLKATQSKYKPKPDVEKGINKLTADVGKNQTTSNKNISVEGNQVKKKDAGDSGEGVPGKIVFRPKYLPDSDWRSEQPCEPLEQSEIKIGTVNGRQSIGESIRTVKSCDKE